MCVCKYIPTQMHIYVYTCPRVWFFFHGQCEFKDFYEKYMVGALGMEKEDEKM